MSRRTDEFLRCESSRFYCARNATSLLCRPAGPTPYQPGAKRSGEAAQRRPRKSETTNPQPCRGAPFDPQPGVIHGAPLQGLVSILSPILGRRYTADAVSLGPRLIWDALAVLNTSTTAFHQRNKTVLHLITAPRPRRSVRQFLPTQIAKDRRTHFTHVVISCKLV